MATAASAPVDPGASVSSIPLADLLALREGHEVVAVKDGSAVSFARFRADIAANAARIAAAGCRRGLLFTDDAYQGAVGLFSILAAGAEVVLPPNGLPGTVASLAIDRDLVVTDTAVGDDARRLPLVAGDPAHNHRCPSLLADQRVWFFTSGSSGDRKVVKRTLGGLTAEVAAVDSVLAALVPPTATVRGSVSHLHVYGLLFRVLWPLATGRVFDPRLHMHWESVLQAMSPDDLLVTGPAHLGRLQGIPPVQLGRGPALVLSAGAPLNDAVAADSRRVLGTAVQEILGSTETGAVAQRRRDRPDPPWRALPTVMVQWDDDGMMQVAGPQLDGVTAVGQPLATADRIEAHGEGFRLLGRGDRVVKIEGKRVSLPELEAALRSLEWVDDAAAVVLDDERSRLAAVIVPNANGLALRATAGDFRLGRLLRRGLVDSFEPSALPRRWRFVDWIPSDAMGKRRHADLAALFTVSSTFSSTGSRPTMPEVRELVRGDASVTLDLWIPPNLAQLDGHFPGRPILPGVVQIDWAVKLASHHLGVADGPARRFQVKFRRVALPGAIVQLHLRNESARGRLVFEYRRRGELLTSGAIRRELA